MQTETIIYKCPICKEGNLVETKDNNSIDSGTCTKCGETSYYSDAIESKANVINLKEVAKAILEKNPYKVIKDEKNREIPATEQTDFLDVLTFSCNQVGRNFQKIPYPTERNFRGAFRKTVSLIGMNGDIIEVIKPSPFSSNWCDDHQKYLRDFKFSSDENTMVFALKLTKNNPGEETENYLLFLSKPMTIKTIQELRQSVYKEEDSKKVNKGLEAIELIWK